jgi:hypothetical protein
MGIISEIILFTSQESRTCTPCINLIREYNVPAKIVRLDTPDARKKAKYNKKISITKVPTLAVVFDDDDIKIYIGGEKICKWLRNFHEQQTKSLEETDERNEDNDAIDVAGSGVITKGNIKIIDTASDEEDGDNTIEEFSLPISGDGSFAGEISKAKSSKMKSTLEIAKEMEAQAKKQLGGDAFSRRNDY